MPPVVTHANSCPMPIWCNMRAREAGDRALLPPHPHVRRDCFLVGAVGIDIDPAATHKPGTDCKALGDHGFRQVSRGKGAVALVVRSQH